MLPGDRERTVLDGDHLETPWQASAFRDAGTSLTTTLQLFVGVDFSAVVDKTVDEAGLSALLFFVTYHVVGVLIVFNLLTAIMIQLYG